MVKYCFIILHYLTIEDTIACVNSIKSLEIYCEQVSIVIVDNASSNGTGKVISEKYKKERNISVILNCVNEGFSRGNNIGCEYAKEWSDPDFYVVLNNDVVIEQLDFCNRIRKEYEEYKFDVLGPDVYNKSLDIHQNPLMETVPTLKEVSRTILFNQIIYNLYPISVPVMYFLKRREKRIKSINLYKHRQEGVVLQGACLIFSKKYVNDKKKVFYPETFLYYEEALLQLWNNMHGYKSVYSPEISVLHNESSSTRVDNKHTIKRWYNGANNIILSASVYLNELKKYTEENRA